MVGVTGFEPAAPCSQSTCATKLRHTPAMEAVPHKQQSNYITPIGGVSSPCGRLTEISEFTAQPFSRGGADAAATTKNSP